MEHDLNILMILLAISINKPVLLMTGGSLIWMQQLYSESVCYLDILDELLQQVTRLKNTQTWDEVKFSGREQPWRERETHLLFTELLCFSLILDHETLLQPLVLLLLRPLLLLLDPLGLLLLRERERERAQLWRTVTRHVTLTYRAKLTLDQHGRLL